MSRRGGVQRQGSAFPWRLVVWAVVLVILVIFIAENFITVEVRLLFTRTETRLAWALIISAALGFIAGWLLPRLRE